MSGGVNPQPLCENCIGLLKSNVVRKGRAKILGGGSSSGDKYPGRRERKKVELLLGWLSDDCEYASEMFRTYFYSDRRTYISRTRSFFQSQEELYSFGINWADVKERVREHGAVFVAEELMQTKRPAK